MQREGGVGLKQYQGGEVRLKQNWVGGVGLKQWYLSLETR